MIVVAYSYARGKHTRTKENYSENLYPLGNSETIIFVWVYGSVKIVWRLGRDESCLISCAISKVEQIPGQAGLLVTQKILVALLK